MSQHIIFRVRALFAAIVLGLGTWNCVAQVTAFSANFQSSAVQANTTEANLNAGTIVGTWTFQMQTNVHIYGDATATALALCPDSNGNGGYGLTANFTNSLLLKSNVTVAFKLARGRNGTTGTGKSFTMVGYDALGSRSFDMQVFANQNQAAGTNGALYWNNSGFYDNDFIADTSVAGDIRQINVSSTGYNSSGMSRLSIQLQSAGYIVSLDKDDNGSFDLVSSLLPYNSSPTTISKISFTGGSGAGNWFDDISATGVVGTAPVNVITNAFVSVQPENQAQLITGWGFDIKGTSGNNVTPSFAQTLFVTDKMNILRVPVWGDDSHPAHPAAGTVIGSYYTDQLYAMTNARAANSNVIFFASKKLDGLNSFPAWAKDANGIIVAQYVTLLADYLQYIYTNGGFSIDVLGVDNESTYNEGNISASDFNSIVNQLRPLAASRGFPLPKQFIGPENYNPDTSWMSSLVANGWQNNLDIVGTHYYPGNRPLASLQTLVSLGGGKPDWHSEVHWDNNFGDDIDDAEAALATIFDCTDTGLSAYVWWAYTRSGVKGGIEQAISASTGGTRPLTTTDSDGTSATLGKLITRAFRSNTNIVVWVLNNTTNVYSGCKINFNRGTLTGPANFTQWDVAAVATGTSNLLSSTNFAVALGARTMTMVTVGYTPVGPDAWYPLDGNVLDVSGNANHGTAVIATNYFLGRIGSQSLAFNGSNSYVQIPRVIGASTNFTISFWLKATNNSGTGNQWYNGNGLVDGEMAGTTNDFGVTLLNGKIAVGIGSPDTTLQSTVTVTNGQWRHVAVTRNAFDGGMAIYLDGVLNTNLTGPTGPRSAPPFLRLGSLQTGSAAKFFNGTLDDVRLYNGLLAPDIISSLSAVPPHPAPLINGSTVSNGVFWLAFTGAPAPYSVLTSTNLLTWTTLYTTNPPGLPVTLPLPFSSTTPQQFYRLQLGP